MTTIWTPERVDELKGRIATGVTLRKIADDMGLKPGQIAGKVYGTGQRQPIRDAEANQADREALADSVVGPWPRQRPPTFPARRCQWGDKHQRCGQRSVTGKSYCAEHAAVAYRGLPADRLERLVEVG